MSVAIYRHHRGLTLLELLVSMAILSAIVALTATIWAQARAWADEAESHGRAGEVERIGAVLLEQWSMRRAQIRLGSVDGPSEALRGPRFEFVTGSPLLFPEVGLVRASWFVAPEVDGGATLQYEETVVRDPGVSVDVDATTATDTSLRRLTLLAACEDARWERRVEVTERDVEGVESERRLWVRMGEAAAGAGPGREGERTTAYRLSVNVDGRWRQWLLAGVASR